MQLTSIAAVFTAIAAVAVAQTAPPQCAFSCLQNTDPHGCQASDVSCLCHNAEFVAAQAQCITAACTNPSDLQQAEAFAQANCLNVGVTLSVPSASGTAPAGSASPTSPSSSSSPAPSATPTGAASALSAPVAVLAGIAACALAL